MDIQNLIDQAAAQGGGVVEIPAGRYVLDKQLVVKSGVRLEGMGIPIYNWGDAGVYGGVVFEVRFGSGPGSSKDVTKSAVILNQSSTIKNIAFDYPDQNPSLNEPIEFGSTIQIYDVRGHYDISVEDCFFFKSYVGVDFRGSKGGGIGSRNLKIRGIKGVCLAACVAVDYVSDWQQFSDMNFNAGAIDQNNLKAPLIRWVASNGKVLDIGGNDWCEFNGVQAWGYAIGANIVGESGYRASGPYILQNCQFDSTFEGVVLSGNINQAVKVMSCNFCPFNSVYGNAGYALVTRPGACVSGLIFTNNYAFGPGAGLIYMKDHMAASSMVISHNIAGGYGDTAVAIYRASNVNVSDNVFNGYKRGVYLSGVSSVVNRDNLPDNRSLISKILG